LGIIGHCTTDLWFPVSLLISVIYQCVLPQGIFAAFLLGNLFLGALNFCVQNFMMVWVHHRRRSLILLLSRWHCSFGSFLVTGGRIGHLEFSYFESIVRSSFIVFSCSPSANFWGG
jgi:hypothetical protein